MHTLDHTTDRNPHRTARTTGVLYLLLGLTGMLGFLLVRPRLFDAADPGATLTNLQTNETLAGLGVALELGIVLSQALVALWFFRLFRPVDTFAAGAVAAFGLMNAVAILGSAAMLATAVQVAGDATLAPDGGQAGTVALLYAVSQQFWGVGNLFFGLWLIPMGWLVLRSGWMPAPLGWILIAGGGAYLLAGILLHLAPGATLLIEALPFVATVGEFWMIGHLLVRGAGSHSPDRTEGLPAHAA